MPEFIQVSSQASPRGTTDAEFLDQVGIPQAPLVEVLDRFPVAVELELVEGGGLVQQLGLAAEEYLLFQMSDGLLEAEAEIQLHKANKVAAASATVAVEQVFASIDVE